MSVRIFYDGTDFRLRGWRKIKMLVNKVISEESKVSGDLNFILTSDEKLRELNSGFLKHDYYTDVISFLYSAEPVLDGEIYISTDTVKINAKNYKVSYNHEMLRVIIHGTLHMCGHNDSTDKERKQMRRMEDFWIENYMGTKNGI